MRDEDPLVSKSTWTAPADVSDFATSDSVRARTSATAETSSEVGFHGSSRMARR
jgi:hypothetical protein